MVRTVPRREWGRSAPKIRRGDVCQGSRVRAPTGVSCLRWRRLVSTAVVVEYLTICVPHPIARRCRRVEPRTNDEQEHRQGEGERDGAGPRPVPRAMRSRTTVQMPHSLHRLRSSLNTMPRCIAHQLSPTSTGQPQNMPRRTGFGSPSIQRHPRKSASVSATLLPPTTSSQMPRALLLGTCVATFASRASLGSSIRACSQQLERRDDNDIAGR